MKADYQKPSDIENLANSSDGVFLCSGLKGNTNYLTKEKTICNYCKHTIEEGKPVFRSDRTGSLYHNSMSLHLYTEA